MCIIISMLFLSVFKAMIFFCIQIFQIFEIFKPLNVNFAKLVLAAKLKVILKLDAESVTSVKPRCKQPNNQVHVFNEVLVCEKLIF